MNFQQSLNSLHSGSVTFRPFVVLHDKGKVFPMYQFTEMPAHYTARFEVEYQGLFRDSLHISYKDGEIIGKRKFENISGKTLELCELGIEISGVTYGKDTKDDYFYHTENPRIYQVMTFPVDYIRSESAGNSDEFGFDVDLSCADPGVVSERIGASPYQPFPAILISNYQTCYGLVHGTLNQDVFYHNYLVRHESNAVTVDILSSFKAIDVLQIAPNRVLMDEWYLGYTDCADNIERIFEKYTKVLRKKLPVSYGRSDLNRHSLVWGSWNDGIWRNVSEEMLLREAKFLKEKFPTVRWIQLDDGYAVFDADFDPNEGAHGLGVPYEGEDGVDYKKFPNGLQHYTDKVRELGLVPAVWIGGFCPVDRKLYQEHPQWFIDYTYRVENTQPLDVSQPEVRDYIEFAFKKMCQSYGFESVKLDFWSYAFEDSHNLYKYKEHSGYEYRRWILSTLRNCLPHDAYLQSGCDIAMGNPFLGEFFTNYRYGDDIGEGIWKCVKWTFLLGTACFANHIGDLFVPNSDSIGIFPGLNRNEAMFCINYCIATHSMVELGGKLSQVTDPDDIRLLKKAVCNPNNGQDVYFIGYDYRSQTDKVPEVMYFKTPHFSRVENSDVLPVRTMAVFNLDEHEKEYTIYLRDMGLTDGAYVLTDVWSSKQWECTDEYTVTVEPHASRLLAVSRKDGIQLWDANIRINSAKELDGTLLLETDYAMADAELLCSEIPQKLLYNDMVIDFTVLESQVVRLNLPGNGILKVIF